MSLELKLNALANLALNDAAFADVTSADALTRALPAFVRGHVAGAPGLLRSVFRPPGE